MVQKLVAELVSAGPRSGLGQMASPVVGRDFVEAMLHDPAIRNELFPVTRHATFLAHAAVSPLPAAVTKSITDYVQRAGAYGQFEYLHRDAETDARRLAAGLLRAQPEEIAFAPSTSAALGLVASGLDWRVGDNVVFPEADFPANIYPWLELRRRGVETRVLAAKPDGSAPTVDDLRPLVDARTRLVSLSTVHYLSGAPIDAAAFGAFLRSRTALLCLDAIQSLGALPCLAEWADFIVADAHKWLLGPRGAAILYVNRDMLDALRPPVVGWKSVARPDDFSHLQTALDPTAKRYEPGSLNAIGIVGLRESLALIDSIGLTTITDRVVDLRMLLLARLREKGYVVFGAGGAQELTGITSFYKPEVDMATLRRRLDENRIVVSLREGADAQVRIRVSPHFYNTETEIEMLCEHL